MRELIEQLYPLNRSLVTEGTDRALEIIREYLPDAKLLEYDTGEKAWTWDIPHRWVVHRGMLSCQGKIIANFDDNPLYLVNYSAPFSGEVTFAELESHLHTRKDRPKAIPFVFKYYERDWGFCLPYEEYQKLDRQAKYHVDIVTEFVRDKLKILEHDVRGECDDTIVVVSNVCHPYQVNDSITGVVLAVRLAQYLARRKNRKSYKFLFLPETIGSIVYLSRNESVIPRLSGGIFTEMLGTNGRLNFQRSFLRESLMDKAALLALSEATIEYNDVDLGEIPTNDEKVFNDPDIGVPMIAFNRWPYDEYHTSDDSPSIIAMEKLDEVYKLVKRIIEIIDADFTPMRRFRGLLFLSGYGLHYDSKRQNQMLRFLDGHHSVIDIAYKCGYPFSEVNSFILKLLDKGLVDYTERCWNDAGHS